jgi:hypothetical protein
VAITSSPRPDSDCRDIHIAMLMAYEIGLRWAMIDRRAEKPAKYIRVRANQKKSVETRTAWKADALERAQLICTGRSKFISQQDLADKILGQWPKANKKRPDRKQLIAAISTWDKAGLIGRAPRKKNLPQ